ncbi:MAG: dCMP hydroxymethylase [Marinovum sp.]|nr:dCMP hydroxymethylase [Marinovum sp.]
MRMYSVSDIRQFFIDELNDKAFTIDRSGQKTIELIGASFLADEPAIFGEVNKDYVDAELRWYESESTNIYDIYEDEKDPPQAWQYSANRHGEINSNYGFLIWNNRFHCQYERALEELEENPDSRRAIMIYNRPDIWMEYNNNGKNDFICTNAVTYYIRNDELQAVVQMRSNDVVFGYKNDFAWQQYVLESLANDLDIQPGFIQWQVQNLHVYERHFHLVK